MEGKNSLLDSKFWDRKEGKFGKAVLWIGGLIGLGLGIWFLNPILAWLIVFTQNLFNFALLFVGFCVFIYVVFVNNMLRTFLTRGYKLLMTYLITGIIKANPVQPYNDRLSTMENDREASAERVKQLRGRKKDNEFKLKEAKDKYDEAERQFKEITELLKTKTFSSDEERAQYEKRQRIIADNLGAAKVNIKTYQEAVDILTKIVKHMGQALDNADVQINRMIRFIETLVNKVQTGEDLGMASRSLRDLFRADADEESILRMARGVIDEKYAQEFGEYETLFHETQDLFTSFDIDSTVSLKEALARIEGSPASQPQLGYEPVIDVQATILAPTEGSYAEVLRKKNA